LLQILLTSIVEGHFEKMIDEKQAKFNHFEWMGELVDFIKPSYQNCLLRAV
jgi:hypothetical protein